MAVAAAADGKLIKSIEITLAEMKIKFNKMENREGNIFYSKNERPKNKNNENREGRLINFWNPTNKELEIIQATGRIPESLIKRRVAECLAREGLSRRFETPDDEIMEFLQKNGFEIERNIPLRAKLFSYITEKYREDIFKEQTN